MVDLRCDDGVLGMCLEVLGSGERGRREGEIYGFIVGGSFVLLVHH